ncbi:hypothetical protein [Schumannella luteola]
MDAPTCVKALGRVAPRSLLLEAGITPWQIEHALNDRRLFRVRRAWYAVPDAPADLVRAVRVGGSLTAVSAARRTGVWSIDDGLLHVSVPRNAARLRSPDDRRTGLRDDSAGTCIHWRRTPGATTRLVEPAVSWLIHALECQPDEYAIVLLDSAMQRGLVTRRELEIAFRDLPDRYRRALARSDGRAQSGTETLARLRLRALGIRVRIQVPIGPDRVDLVVGDRLVIECLSREHHTGVENYASDRGRELRMIDGRLLTMTLSYEQVMFQWSEVERVILGRIADRDHLWPRSRHPRNPVSQE